MKEYAVNLTWFESNETAVYYIHVKDAEDALKQAELMCIQAAADRADLSLTIGGIYFDSFDGHYRSYVI